MTLPLTTIAEPADRLAVAGFGPPANDLGKIARRPPSPPGPAAVLAERYLEALRAWPPPQRAALALRLGARVAAKPGAREDPLAQAFDELQRLIREEAPPAGAVEDLVGETLCGRARLRLWLADWAPEEAQRACPLAAPDAARLAMPPQPLETWGERLRGLRRRRLRRSRAAGEAPALGGALGTEARPV